MVSSCHSLIYSVSDLSVPMMISEMAAGLGGVVCVFCRIGLKRLVNLLVHQRGG